MIRLQVYKTVSVRDVDPGDLIETYNGGGVLRVVNVTRDGADFVLACRPPSRDQGRHVLVKLPPDAEVRLLPNLVVEAQIMAAFDPSGLPCVRPADEGSWWRRDSSVPGYVTWSTEVLGWTLAIVGQMKARALGATEG